MEYKNEISDELLAKYLSGKTSKEEEEIVLAYLSESDENVDDLLNMSAAVELHHSKQKKNVEKRNRFLWAASAAAAIIVLIVVGVFVFNNNENSEEQFAQKNSQQAQQNESAISDTSSIKHSSPKTTKTDSVLYQINEPKHYADSAKKRNYVNMVYPVSKLTSINGEKQSMTFRWSTDAVGIHLVVKTKENRIIVNQDLGIVKLYKLNLPNDVDTLNWNAVFTYSDGSTAEKKGTIIRWDVGINGVK